MNIGGKKFQVQQFINWGKQTNTYNPIKTNTLTSSNIEEERSNRLEQIKAQLPKMNEGDFIIWKTDYAINSNPPHFLKASHIGIIESVDLKSGTIIVIEGNANEYVTENNERVLVQNNKQRINGDQLIGEPQEVNRRDGLIRKVYKAEDFAKYGYSGFIDNTQRVPKK